MNKEEKRQLIEKEIELAKTSKQDEVIEIMNSVAKDERLQKKAKKTFEKEIKNVRFTI